MSASMGPPLDTPVRFERVAIVGLGLIGGSLSLAARARGVFGEVVGIGRGRANLEEGVACGAVDRFTHDVAEGVAGADLVVLAVPVASMGEVASRLAPALSPDAVVTDVGSVKGPVVTAVEAALDDPGRFVGGHPIAGTERSGVSAAFPELFEGRRSILTPTDRTDAQATARVRALWEAVGASVAEMTPQAHDRTLALVSHLPHFVAYALMMSVDARERAGESSVEFSAGGLSDFTRIAGSDPVMWRDIALENAGAVLEATAHYRAQLERIEAWISAGDGDALEQAFGRSREVRERIVALRERAGRPREDGD